MKVTLSAIKADIGSDGGHVLPGAKEVETVGKIVAEEGRGLLNDSRGGFTGDDIAILTSRASGTGSGKVRMLARDAFLGGAETAKAQGPCGIGRFVAGFMRGGHHGSRMPVPKKTGTFFLDGPPVVSRLAFSAKEGRFTGPAVPPGGEPAYGGIVERLKDRDCRFRIQGEK